MRKSIAALAAGTGALATAAFAWGAPAGGGVGVTLTEFKVVPKPLSITSGKVTFTVRNAGKLDHELVVLRTATAPGRLAVKGAKAVETGRVGRVGPLKPGKSAKLVLTLKAGRYVLLCNVAGHYAAKQFAGFTVR